MAVGETLAQAVEHELQVLSMSAARFVITFRRTPDPPGSSRWTGPWCTPLVESVNFFHLEPGRGATPAGEDRLRR